MLVYIHRCIFFKTKLNKTLNYLFFFENDKMASSSHQKLIVISGGQTGADQAALFAAKDCDLVTGGWAPKDYFTLDGLAPWLKQYGLKEMSDRNYVARSIKNVQDSDATVAFRTHLSSGTDKTIGYALTKKWQCVEMKSEELSSAYKPVFIVSDINSVDQQNALVKFIRDHNVRILNVCGHREIDKIEKKWTCAVRMFLIQVFTRLF